MNWYIKLSAINSEQTLKFYISLNVKEKSQYIIKLLKTTMIFHIATAYLVYEFELIFDSITLQVIPEWKGLFI